MNWFLVLMIISFSQLSFSLSQVERLNQNGVALCVDRSSKSDADCYDPVSYVKDKKAQKVGLENSKKFRTQFKGAYYVFSSQEHLDLFVKNPEPYLPQFGGWCAYAVSAKKAKVDIDPKSFLIQDNKLLLFYDGFLSDTRDFWLNDKKKDAKTYLSDAITHWPAVQNKEP